MSSDQTLSPVHLALYRVDTQREVFITNSPNEFIGDPTLDNRDGCYGQIRVTQLTAEDIDYIRSYDESFINGFIEGFLPK